ncbi:hypothetical protein N7491_005469 [Penicillium cf. griseofulvum]|nr:hypothetical protein N7491_005469 [Penicillium cf. griseofulvum]KAJ5452706.1 hypothetical protein N7445_000889 [Penicillium cf. griseofulvum]
MADESPSLQNLFDELGFPPSEHQFLLRLFSSSDPFAGLPGADLEATHSRDQSGQLSSTSIARRLASTSLWQVIILLSGVDFTLTCRPRSERANQLRPPPHHRPSGFREGLERRDLVHYEEEWTSIIATDPESLFSELRQQLASDNEHPCLESPELPEHSKASENVASPRTVGPPSPSVYDSETGEPPNSVVSLNETRGTQDNCGTSQDPRTLNEPGSFEQLIQSFPRPPGRNQTVWDQSCPRVSSDSQRALQKDSTQANTSTVASSQIKSVTILPRISRFSEEFSDSNPIREQDSSSICAKANTSALDTSGLGNLSTGSSGISLPPSIEISTVVNARDVSSQVPPRSPGTSFRGGQQVKPEISHQTQERGSQYIIFPEYPSQVRPISEVIRRQRTFNSIFEGCPASIASSPRYYQKTPLRISSRPSRFSFSSGKKSTQKCKRVLKRFVKKLRHLLCRARKRPGTPSTLTH